MSELWGDVAAWLIAILAVEAITEIVVASDFPIFLQFRNWLGVWALPDDEEALKQVRWYQTFLQKLFTCGYCFSVWVAFLVVWFLPGGYLGMWPLDNFVLKLFALHRLSNWLHVFYELVRRGRVHTVDKEVKLKIEGPVTIIAEHPNARTAGE